MQSGPDRTEPQPERAPIPEMVGATAAPFRIGGRPTEISLAVQPPTGPARAAAAAQAPRTVILSIENVTSDARAPSFDVYLNVPAGDPPEQHPERFAGRLGLFGLVESSDPDAPHGGGMSFTLDVTGLVARLMALNAWDPQSLRVSFVATAWPAPVPAVRVGRVSLYLM